MTLKFDARALLERVDGDIEFLAETVQMLGEDCLPLVQQIQEAAASRDAYALEKSAHTLKGMFGNFCAEPAEAIAREVETKAREDKLTGIDSTVQLLQTETEQLQAALKRFLLAKKQ